MLKLVALSGARRDLVAAGSDAAAAAQELARQLGLVLLYGAAPLLLLLSGIGAVILAFAVAFQSEDDAAGACPQIEARLNPYEYELQRRRCEAVQHGAARRHE